MNFIILFVFGNFTNFVKSFFWIFLHLLEILLVGILAKTPKKSVIVYIMFDNITPFIQTIRMFSGDSGI